MRNGEGDQSSLCAVDQSFLDETVAGRGKAGWLTAEQFGDRGRRHRLVADLGHGAHVVTLGGGGALVAAAEETDGQLLFGLRCGQPYIVDGDRTAQGEIPR